MTPSSPGSWSSTVASLRKASEGRLAGGRAAPAHFERYVNLLFRLTVAHKDSATRLTDGRYLRPAAWLDLDFRAGRQLRVQALTRQYQNAAAADSRVFRADYSRAKIAAASPPRGHLHVDGTLLQPGVLRPKQPLGRVLSPRRRPTLEAAVLLLAGEFGVPTNAPHEVWRAAVADHEGRSARLFDS